MNKSLINILVNNPYDTVLFKSIEASNKVANVEYILRLLDDIEKEIGEQILI